MKGLIRELLLNKKAIVKQKKKKMNYLRRRIQKQIRRSEIKTGAKNQLSKRIKKIIFSNVFAEKTRATTLYLHDCISVGPVETNGSYVCGESTEELEKTTFFMQLWTNKPLGRCQGSKIFLQL